MANAWWLQVARGPMLWDHEEQTYAYNVTVLPHAHDLHEAWGMLHASYFGPVQALLGWPVAQIIGPDERIVVWENLLLTAATGLIVHAITRRLADDAAAMAALVLTLVCSGMLENARGALTMVPATTFAALAMLVLVRDRGLVGWPSAVALGVAVAAVGLSRPMAVVFTVALAVPAVAWARADGAAWRTISTRAAAAVMSAIVASAWWWYVTHDEVLTYLSEGSSGVASGGPSFVFANRSKELVLYLDPFMPLVAKNLGAAFDHRGIFFPGITPAIAIAAATVLWGVDRWRRPVPASADLTPVAAPPPAEATSPVATGEPASQGVPPLAAWPIGVAAAIGFVASMASDTVGWLLLPLVPWIIVAAVVLVRQRLTAASWRIWTAAVVLPALGASIVTSAAMVPGNRFTWCQEPFQKTNNCAITSDATGAWKADIRTISTQLVATHDELAATGTPPVTVIAARDTILRPTAFNLEALVSTGRTVAGTGFPADGPPRDQLRRVGATANIVVIVDDPGVILLDKGRMASDDISTGLLAMGFEPCGTTVLPDERKVTTLVRAPRSLETCS